ncbi:MAG: hypothetical protein OEV74_21115 [Cyclobacteriaceae bacterium]|nr:hypothetical protein [Cyclobacteriaceae bacterium]MDH4298786.1 hypothetical protein [Cyclobacteriaceae bacterium]MDH5248257.1 hypothetical protein [Cyclobacteriaceae bacterium]
MLIDWFTVIAQLINFIILIWLLKRFLYKPVLKALDDRENLIAQKIRDADTKMADADKALETYQEKNMTIERERMSMLNQAKEAAKTKHDELINEAKKESDRLRSTLRKSLAIEQQRLGGEIMNRAAAEVFAVARKTLKDLASIEVEEQMVALFIERLRNPDDKERAEMKQAFGSPREQVAVQSAFEISEGLQARIKDAIKESTGGEVQINFVFAPGLINGIELTVDGYKVSWNISAYLSDLETSVIETLRHNAVVIERDQKDQTGDKNGNQ